MKLLFIKLGAIGDVVQAAVAVKEYRRQNPDCQIDWVVGRSLRSLVEALEVATKIIEIDDVGLFSSSTVQRFRTLLASITALSRCHKYDRIVTAYSDYRYRLLSLGVQSRERNRFHLRADRPSPIYSRNRVHEYWRLLTGVDSLPIDIDFATQCLGERRLLRVCEGTFLQELPARYVVIAPGGAKNANRDDWLRRWPIANYRALAEQLLASGDNVVLVGGPTDRWVSEYFGDLPVKDLIGRTTLLNLVPLLHRAEVVVTNDSGIMHLATLTRAGIVALFGPTPANACIPLGRDRTIVLDQGNKVSCSPCYDGRNYAVCSRNICLEAISVERVLLAVKSLRVHTDVRSVS